MQRLRVHLFILSVLALLSTAVPAHAERVNTPGTYKACVVFDPPYVPLTPNIESSCLATAVGYAVHGDLTIRRAGPSSGFLVQFDGTFVPGADDPQRPVTLRIQAHFSNEWLGAYIVPLNEGCLEEWDIAHLERATVVGRAITGGAGDTGALATMKARLGEQGQLLDCHLGGSH